jgi:polysaccharide export outer membrane protein
MQRESVIQPPTAYRLIRLRPSGYGGQAPCALRPAALAVLFLLLLPCLAASQEPSPDYLVGPQDVLSITVWDQADLSGKFTVEADGSFNFPLIGRVQAGGLPLRAIEAELKKKLADGYFKNPQLTVAVDTYRSQRVFIVGEVRVPGTYTLTGNMSLIEALSRAGSTTPTASTEAVIVHAPEGKATSGPVLPGQSDATETVRVDLNDLQSGGSAKNVALRDGDTVFVPRAETIYVFGQVKNPGAYALQSKETTVMQALSLAGGVTDRGSTGRLKVVRIVKGVKKEIKVKLTDLVQPGDTLVVPERFF